MNLYKLTYRASGHAVLIDVLNTVHALQVAGDERIRTEGEVNIQLWQEERGSYLTTTMTKAPCGTRPCGLEKVMWYELPESRKMRVTNGNGFTYTQDREAS
jgi:hypothetical protein